MKIVVLDGYSLELGNGSPWEPLSEFAQWEYWERTPAEKTVERAAGAETETVKEVTDRACDLISYRLRHEEYLTDSAYGKMLLEHFDLCRKTMTVGYAKFLLPRVLEWLTANRQYKQAYELIFDFPEKRN